MPDQTISDFLLETYQKINTEIGRANSATGEGDSSLHDAVTTLISGYGATSMETGTFIPTSRLNTYTFSVSKRYHHLAVLAELPQDKVGDGQNLTFAQNLFSISGLATNNYINTVLYVDDNNKVVVYDYISNKSNPCYGYKRVAHTSDTGSTVHVYIFSNSSIYIKMGSNNTTTSSLCFAPNITYRWIAW